jgi:hypothetical protein
LAFDVSEQLVIRRPRERVAAYVEDPAAPVRRFDV